MSVANFFGASETDFLLKFAFGGYTPLATDFGGSSAITDALQGAEDEVIQAMGADLWRNVTDPELELIETRGTLGQTTAQLGITPILTKYVWVWRGQPAVFQRDRPMKQTDRQIDQQASYGPMVPASPLYGPQYDLSPTQFSVNAAGLVTVTTVLQANEQIFASYRVDTTNASFSMESIAQLVATIAAAALGAKVYPREDSTWAYVEKMKEESDDLLDQLNKGLWTPSEIRLLRWWKPVEKAQENTIGSVRRWRA